MKIKYKNICLFFIVLFVVSIFVYLLFFKNNTKNTQKKTYKYSNETIEKFEKLGIKDKVDLNNYSKTLELAVDSTSFNKDYVVYYSQIKYYEKEKLIQYINVLAKEGLAINEINEVFENFIRYDNFDINNVKRYTSFKVKNNTLSNQDVVTRVNLSLDKPYYTDTKRVVKQDDMLALVNKYNYVDMSYVPKNLKSLFNNKNIKLVDVAADAYEEFVNAAKKDGITFVGTTAYRDAGWQKSLYDSYVNKDGKEKADTYSARPGYSEHQLGYSVDLNDPNYTAKRISPSDYEWIKNNSYKYGFIIRFPENKENITGYQHENWHIRFVGKEVAQKIHDLNITFDEYYDLYIVKH